MATGVSPAVQVVVRICTRCVSCDCDVLGVCVGSAYFCTWHGHCLLGQWNSLLKRVSLPRCEKEAGVKYGDKANLLMIDGPTMAHVQIRGG